jgi:predicted O-methyltransferase YrrM
MNDIDLYSTHIEFIKEIFKLKGILNKVVEFGTGNYSTQTLIENSNEVISIEMQSKEWYEEMKNKFEKAQNWKIIESIGPYTYENLDLYDNTDFCFVDGHGDSRPECINMMISKKCPIIMSHDTEEEGYGWKRVISDDYYSITFKKYKNWTTLWTLDINLYNLLATLIFSP